MDLSNAHELYIPEGEVTEIRSLDGVIWRKRTYFSALIAAKTLHSSGGDALGSYGIAMIYKGKGNIYTDGQLVAEVDNTEIEGSASRIVVSQDTELGIPHKITFQGDFTHIGIEDVDTSSTTTVFNGDWLEISSWDSNTSYTYEDLFAGNQGRNLISYPELPSWVTELKQGTFNATGLSLVFIPRTINKIESRVFGDSWTYIDGQLKDLYFEHDPYAVLDIPEPTNTTAMSTHYGMAYSKSAYSMNIYTENLQILNYDWAADNVTPTFYHLDGTPYEEPPINDDSQYAQYMDFTATEPFIVFTFENQPMKIVSLDQSGNEVDPVYIDNPDSDVTLEIIPTTSVVDGDTPNMRVYTVENGTFAVLADSVVDSDGRLADKLSEYGWSQGETIYLPTVIAPYLGYVAANPRGPDIEDPDPYNRIVCWDNITDSDDQVEESDYWVQI